MIELDSSQAGGYLASQLEVRTGDLRIIPLGGGVSNIVLLAEAGGVRCVAKQSLEKLRVAQDWRSKRERIHRECDALRLAAGVMQAHVPGILFEDRANFAFGMQAAPPEAHTWKDLLLAGEVDARTAETTGSLLGGWIRESSARPEWSAEFLDLSGFEELRIDPYYRSAALQHPDLAPQLARLLQDCSARRVSLVHGDFSPKNLLVWKDRLWIIDWEVAHWGDPSFDTAFLVNHLLLKSFHNRRHAAAYREAAEVFLHAVQSALPSGFEWVESATMQHLGWLLLARVDGKSPAEYIREESVKVRIRSAARELILRTPSDLSGAYLVVERWI